MVTGIVLLVVAAVLTAKLTERRPAPRSLETTPSTTSAPTTGAARTADPAMTPRTSSTRRVVTGPATTRPATLAARLATLPAETRQVVIVHAPGYGTSHATLETFERTATTGWWPAFPAMPARIGEAGFRDDAREGLSGTPVGVFRIGATMYGLAADPGVRYQYHRIVTGDYWNGNSDSPGYNTFTHGTDPGGASEALWRVGSAYNHFLVIEYNTPATPGKGSAMFLHQNIARGYTEGCVTLARADLVKVLTWLDPAASPRIVLAPNPALSRY
jgi:L,D-peptidoglycan transpeptidase YkuD (ErfK/YbiS/YcfS/YnhG family)